ncbi:MAG TPA: hypothetical protein VMV49_00540 [Candidatus Deferrimicrobium sp.]|nr:hypothetical protein [Candidatus Deferrimicrobium sp.]
MKKKEFEYIIYTVILCTGFGILTYFLWIHLNWGSLIILLPGAIILELLILQWIDKKHVIEEKQKLIQLGLLTSSDLQLTAGTSETDIEQFKNFIRLNLTDLNELLLSLEEAYREALIKIDQGEIEEAKLQFLGVFKSTQTKFNEVETEVQNLIEEFPVDEEDKEQKFLYKSYTEQWISEKQNKLKKIEELNKKFQVRTEFNIYVEDILRFEVEKEREISDLDIKTLKFPYHQAKQLIKFIEKPFNLKVDYLSKDEKQKLGSVGRKIIEKCAEHHISPNLPYLVIKLGMSLVEAKKILTYLHSVGMIDQVYVHYKK